MRAGRLWAPFLAAIAGMLVGGIAFASIPSSSGVISGCYSKYTGALRVIDASSQTCSKAQTPISWNQTGPSGPGIVAEGQTLDAKGSTKCTYGGGEITFCNPTTNSTFNNLGPSTAMTFTPSANAECLVSVDGQIVSNQNDGAAVQFGIGENTAAGDQSVDGTEVTATMGDFGEYTNVDNAASLARTRIIPVQAGTTYTFELWIQSPADYNGAVYFDEDYVCFAS